MEATQSQNYRFSYIDPINNCGEIVYKDGSITTSRTSAYFSETDYNTE